MTFFIEGPAPDSDYRAIRDLPHGKPYREFIERLWARFDPSPDPHFRRDSTAHFHQRFCEMYLFCSLFKRGLEVRKGGQSGPDFYFIIEGRRYWVEAIAPGPGSGTDKGPLPHVGKASYVPIDKILLRYTNALDEKLSNWRKWKRKGIVNDGDGYIIAINARKIPDADLGNELPYFVRAFLPFGNLSWTIDRNTLAISESYFPYCDYIIKENNSSVSTAPLLDPVYSPLSAIIHSFSGFTDREAFLGEDFTILRNPLARIPFPPTSFAWCRQYHFEDSRLFVREPSAIQIDWDIP